MAVSLNQVVGLHFRPMYLRHVSTFTCGRGAKNVKLYAYLADFAVFLVTPFWRSLAESNRSLHRDSAQFHAIMKRLAPGAAPVEGGPFTKGLYGVSEMLIEAFLGLIDAGILKRDVDGVTLHGAFFLGPKSLYRALREMPSDQIARIQMMPVSFTNQLYGDEDAKRRARVDARFINTAMMATLMGAAISDGLEDGQVVSGVGGQYNFVAQAFALEGARSVLALESTRQAGRKTLSNMRWNYGHQTIPRHLRDVFVTEYGIADVRGKSDAETIAAMLAVTDSRFQDELAAIARDAGKLPKEFEIPRAHRENFPERIAQALKPARDAGLLPSFPFGSDFDRVEQRLIPALQLLREAQRMPLRLPGLLWQGMGSRRTPQTANAWRGWVSTSQGRLPSAPIARWSTRRWRGAARADCQLSSLRGAIATKQSHTSDAALWIASLRSQ